MIVKGRYVKGGTANHKAAHSGLNAHIKYIEYRKMDGLESHQNRSIFSKESDQVNRKEAVSEVMEHTSQQVSYHKMVLSPGEDEPVQDWKQWTREVMADLEEKQEKELHWFAVHHRNTEHPHVHVIVAGAGEHYETGREEAVKLYKEDYQQLRESGHTHSDHDFYHRLDELLKEVERQDDVAHDPVARDLEERSLSAVSADDHLLDQGDHDR